jgi:acetylornithine deacetylase/succinyl-diaminopimelate desuccinylase-like protein
MELQQEAVELLQRLIRFDTVNPPGAEREAIEFLRGYLEEAGLECELLSREEDRPNLVARLRGESDGPTLGFLSHVDTVLATPEEWSHDPWSGDLADGCVWGRGALDMKSQTAAEVVAAATLARDGWRPPRGELLLMAVADEEAGGRYGAQFLTEQHPDRVRCDYLVNEGGGAAFEWEGRRRYGLCSAEKGVFRFRVTTDGVAGHASIPRMGDNALLKMAPLLERLADRQPGFDVGEEPRALFRQLLGEELDGDPLPAVERLRESDPLLALLIEPTLGVSVTPTRIRASEKINVIPSRAELDVDCRVPPGLDEDAVLERVREVLGSDGYRLEFLERVGGNRSPLDSPMVEAIDGWLEEEDPGAELVPIMLAGFTDSRWFREAFPDCLAYGFCPQRHMSLHESAPLIHGADERIDVRDLGMATRFFAELPRRLLA